MKKGKYGDVGHFVKYMEHSLKLKDMARDTKTSRPVTKKKGDNLMGEYKEQPPLNSERTRPGKYRLSNPTTPNSKRSRSQQTTSQSGKRTPIPSKYHPPSVQNTNLKPQTIKKMKAKEGKRRVLKQGAQLSKTTDWRGAWGDNHQQPRGGYNDAESERTSPLLMGGGNGGALGGKKGSTKGSQYGVKIGHLEKGQTYESARELSRNIYKEPIKKQISSSEASEGGTQKAAQKEKQEYLFTDPPQGIEMPQTKWGAKYFATRLGSNPSKSTVQNIPSTTQREEYLFKGSHHNESPKGKTAKSECGGGGSRTTPKMIIEKFPLNNKTKISTQTGVKTHPSSTRLTDSKGESLSLLSFEDVSPNYNKKLGDPNSRQITPTIQQFEIENASSQIGSAKEEKWREFSYMLANLYDDSKRDYRDAVKQTEILSKRLVEITVENEKLLELLSGTNTEVRLNELEGEIRNLRRQLEREKTEKNAIKNERDLQNQIISQLNSKIKINKEEIISLRRELSTSMISPETEESNGKTEGNIAFYKKLSEHHLQECSGLAEQLICLRSDLEKSNLDFMRMQRSKMNENLVPTESAPTYGERENKEQQHIRSSESTPKNLYETPIGNKSKCESQRIKTAPHSSSQQIYSPNTTGKLNIQRGYAYEVKAIPPAVMRGFPMGEDDFDQILQCPMPAQGKPKPTNMEKPWTQRVFQHNTKQVQIIPRGRMLPPQAPLTSKYHSNYKT